MSTPKLRDCRTCLFNVVLRCEVIYHTILKQTDIEPSIDRTKIFDKPVPCKRWKDRRYLKCNKCKFAVKNETGRPITCVNPIPGWAFKLVGYRSIQNPITKTRANNCTNFKEIANERKKQ